MCTNVCCILDTKRVSLAQWQRVEDSSPLPGLPYFPFLSIGTMERLATWWLEGLSRYIYLYRCRSTHISSLFATTISNTKYTDFLLGMYLLFCKLFLTIIQVQQKRWKVETFSRLDSVLLLSSVNLPGGVLVSPVAMVTATPCARSQFVPSLILRFPCTRALASFPWSSPPASLGTGEWAWEWGYKTAKGV